MGFEQSGMLPLQIFFQIARRVCGCARVKSVFLAGLVSLGACTAEQNAHAWDVNETGQPSKSVEISVNEGTWISLDVSPDGAQIAFDLLGDIYVMPAGGGKATLIHSGPAMERNPRFSPDGNSILYVSDRSGNENLWMSNVDGTNAKAITDQTEVVFGIADWSPDGQYIAVSQKSTAYDKFYASELRMYHVSGGLGRVVVPYPDNKRDVQEPVFSPAGDALFYTKRITDPHIYVDANHKNYAIMAQDFASGETEQLIGGFGGAFAPQVSPDGKKIAFVRRVKEKSVLFVFDRETKTQTPVYDDLDRDQQANFYPAINYYPGFSWFPDNRQIAIWGKGKLFKIDSETRAATQIPFEATATHKIIVPPKVDHGFAPDAFQPKIISALEVSSDGREAVFHMLGQLWRMSLPAGKPERLTNAGSFEFDPALSPTGKAVAFVDWDDERGSTLTIANLQGTTEKQVLNSKGIVRTPRFSRDGHKIVYQIEPGNKEAGGLSATPGLYWSTVSGGEATHIDIDGVLPQFSPDGQRIYYWRSDYASGSKQTHLESVNLNGLDRHSHAVADGPDRRNFRLSPDAKWIAFKEDQELYVMPLMQTAEPLQITAASSEVPVTRLTQDSGYAASWSADSASVHWTLGPKIFSASIADQFSPKSAKSDDVTLTVPSDVPEGTVAFTNAQLITMVGDEVIENGTIVVEKNRIIAIGAADQVQIPAGAKVVDATDKTILPGFVDMHGHILCCYYGGLMPQKQPGLYAALAFGVTTNYDPYTAELEAYESMELQQAGLIRAPRMINVGKVVYGRKGKADATYTPFESLEDAESVMRRKRALGGTIVKSYKIAQRSRRQQLVKAGRAAGVLVDAEGECNFYLNIGMLLDGHAILEHNLPVANYYDDVIKLFASSGVANTPTLIVTFGEMMGENYAYQTTKDWTDPKINTFIKEINSGYSPLGTPYSAPYHVRAMTTILAADEIHDLGFRAVARSLKEMDDNGVLVNVGSHGQVYGYSMHQEMWLISEGGMSNHHVLRAATLNGAKTLGIDDKIGSLEEGKLADIIVLDKNPLTDIKNTNTVRYTMINGRLFDSFTMNEIGNYDTPRSKYYWEAADYGGINWSEAWGADD